MVEGVSTRPVEQQGQDLETTRTSRKGGLQRAFDKAIGEAVTDKQRRELGELKEKALRDLDKAQNPREMSQVLEQFSIAADRALSIDGKETHITQNTVLQDKDGLNLSAGREGTQTRPFSEQDFQQTLTNLDVAQKSGQGAFVIYGPFTGPDAQQQIDKAKQLAAGAGMAVSLDEGQPPSLVVYNPAQGTPTEFTVERTVSLGSEYKCVIPPLPPVMNNGLAHKISAADCAGVCRAILAGLDHGDPTKQPNTENMRRCYDGSPSVDKKPGQEISDRSGGGETTKVHIKWEHPPQVEQPREVNEEGNIESNAEETSTKTRNIPVTVNGQTPVELKVPVFMDLGTRTSLVSPTNKNMMYALDNNNIDPQTGAVKNPESRPPKMVSSLNNYVSEIKEYEKAMGAMTQLLQKYPTMTKEAAVAELVKKGVQMDDALAAYDDTKALKQMYPDRPLPAAWHQAHQDAKKEYSSHEHEGVKKSWGELNQFQQNALTRVFIQRQQLEATVMQAAVTSANTHYSQHPEEFKQVLADPDVASKLPLKARQDIAAGKLPDFDSLPRNAREEIARKFTATHPLEISLQGQTSATGSVALNTQLTQDRTDSAEHLLGIDLQNDQTGNVQFGGLNLAVTSLSGQVRANMPQVQAMYAEYAKDPQNFNPDKFLSDHPNMVLSASEVDNFAKTLQAAIDNYNKHQPDDKKIKQPLPPTLDGLPPTVRVAVLENTQVRGVEAKIGSLQEGTAIAETSNLKTNSTTGRIDLTRTTDGKTTTYAYDPTSKTITKTVQGQPPQVVPADSEAGKGIAHEMSGLVTTMHAGDPGKADDVAIEVLNSIIEGRQPELNPISGAKVDLHGVTMLGGNPVGVKAASISDPVSQKTYDFSINNAKGPGPATYISVIDPVSNTTSMFSVNPTTGGWVNASGAQLGTEEKAALTAALEAMKHSAGELAAKGGDPVSRQAGKDAVTLLGKLPAVS